MTIFASPVEDVVGLAIGVICLKISSVKQNTRSTCHHQPNVQNRSERGKMSHANQTKLPA